MDHLDEMMTFNLVSNTSSCCDSWFRIRRAEAQSVTRGGLHLSRMDHERTIHHFHEPERSHCEPALRLSVPPLQLSDWRCHNLILYISYSCICHLHTDKTQGSKKYNICFQNVIGMNQMKILKWSTSPSNLYLSKSTLLLSTIHELSVLDDKRVL